MYSPVARPSDRQRPGTRYRTSVVKCYIITSIVQGADMGDVLTAPQRRGAAVGAGSWHHGYRHDSGFVRLRRGMATQPAVIDALAWLDAHSNLELAGRRATPSLERIFAMIELLGSPQRAYPLLHITGTNRKTSVTRMVARLHQFQGLSVGAYTSPHLERVNETHPLSPTPLVEGGVARRWWRA
jgi:UDP-N-acetylmuramate-alanine ligase